MRNVRWSMTSWHQRRRRGGLSAGVRGARFCPRCLAEDGAWRLTHYLTWSFVCARHRCLLVDRCPECAALQRIGERFLHIRGAAHICWHRRPGAGTGHGERLRCQADLRCAHARLLPVDHPLVNAQNWVDAVIETWMNDPGADIDLAGVTIPAPAALDAISTLVREMATTGVPRVCDWVVHAGQQVPTRVSAEIDDLVSAAALGTKGLADLTSDGPLFGTLVAVALDVLRAPSLQGAAHALERLADVGGVLGLSAMDTDGADRRRQSRHKSPFVETIWIRARQESFTASERLSFRVDSPLPRHPSVPYIFGAVAEATGDAVLVGRTSVSARHVPSVIWPSVASVLPRVTVKHTPAFGVSAAMALVRMGC